VRSAIPGPSTPFIGKIKSILIKWQLQKLASTSRSVQDVWEILLNDSHSNEFMRAEYTNRDAHPGGSNQNIHDET
jgi:hypothetical protein